MKKIKWKKRKLSKKEVILAGVVLFILIAMLGIFLYIKSDKIGNAFDSERYDKVQITITQSVTSLNDTYETDEYDGESVSGEDSATETREICTMKKDGSTLYESGYREQYRYERDGEEFILYYDDFYGINAENGDWVEIKADSYDAAFSFDFAVLDNYKKSDFKKSDDYYIPKENVEKVFFEFLQIVQQDKYYNCNMKFYFENHMITKIVASYNYDSQLDVVQTYEFSYKNEDIEVPKADIQYQEESNITN